jgi:hypothetical protein
LATSVGSRSAAAPPVRVGLLGAPAAPAGRSDVGARLARALAVVFAGPTLAAIAAKAAADGHSCE